MKAMLTKQNIVRDLVTAMLAVNSWTLEKAYSILPGLEQAGLLDPENLRSLSEEEIAVKLNSSGYARGTFMLGSMTRRFKSLGEVLVESRLSDILASIEKQDLSKTEQILSQINGVGPAVLRNFKILIDSPSPVPDSNRHE